MGNPAVASYIWEVGTTTTRLAISRQISVLSHDQQTKIFNLSQWIGLKITFLSLRLKWPKTTSNNIRYSSNSFQMLRVKIRFWPESTGEKVIDSLTLFVVRFEDFKMDPKWTTHILRLFPLSKDSFHNNDRDILTTFWGIAIWESILAFEGKPTKLLPETQEIGLSTKSRKLSE